MGEGHFAQYRRGVWDRLRSWPVTHDSPHLSPAVVDRFVSVVARDQFDRYCSTEDASERAAITAELVSFIEWVTDLVAGDDDDVRPVLIVPGHGRVDPAPLLGEVPIVHAPETDDRDAEFDAYANDLDFLGRQSTRGDGNIQGETEAERAES